MSEGPKMGPSQVALPRTFNDNIETDNQVRSDNKFFLQFSEVEVAVIMMVIWVVQGRKYIFRVGNRMVES